MTDGIGFTITQIEYVLAVHRHGHFAHAARECHVTQPTLSQQIQKLEDQLGIVIFDRSKKPILVTSAGQKLIEQMQTIIYEVKKIPVIVSSTNQKTKVGSLTLGVIPTIAPYLLPLLLPTLEKKYPDIQLKIIELQTHRITQALQSDEIDVGLLATPLNIPKLYEFALYHEPFYVLCKKNHPLAAQSKVKYTHLKYDDVWLLEEGHCLRNQVLDICDLKKISNYKRNFQFESGSIETVKNLVRAYGGYTFVPALACETGRTHDPSKTVWLEFERPIPARQIGLVYLREHYKSSLIEALGESIIASIPEELRKLRQKDLDVLPV